MADIFDEIEEGMRQDRAAALWARYGNYVIGGALLFILGVAAFWGFHKYETHRQTQAGEAYLTAIRAKESERDPLLEKVSGEGGAFALLAQAKLAAAALEHGDKDKAKALFSKIALDPSVDSALQGAAAMKAAYLELETKNPQGAINLVAPYDKEGDPYRFLAIEILGLAALEQEDTKKAKEFFVRLRDLGEADHNALVVAGRAEQILEKLGE